jgi:peptidoglycan/xylan/chitin deacetylase (PgdA/CDA1 family)
MKNKPNWVWPNDKRIAVVFNVCLEAWSDGKAPGISPMGNPLPAGVLDTMAISWAAYGVEVGIHRLMDGFARHGAKASVMTNAVIAERAPDTVKAIAERGHEVLSHSYAMDVIPALLSDEADHAETPRRRRLSLVRRRVRQRPALRRQPRQQEDRRHSAVLRRQRHAVDEIRPSAAHDAGIVQRGDRHRPRA